MIRINIPFESYWIKELYYSTKQSPLSFLPSQMKIETLSERKISLKNLNISLYELKLVSNSLKDFFNSGIFNKISMVSKEPKIITGENLISTSSLSKFVSYSVEEITGNPFATPETLIRDVWGYLIIQGKKILVGMDERGNFQPFTLKNLKTKILEIAPDVEVKIENNRLYIFSNGELNIADMTAGGKKGGIGIRFLPKYGERELIKYVFSNNQFLKLEDFKKVASFSASQITGISEADENTPLFGVYGKIIIQGQEFQINSYGMVDTLNTLKERINQNSLLQVRAEIDEEKRLVIRPKDIGIKISIEDQTSGGEMNGLGLSRSAESSEEDLSASTFFEEYRANIISVAKKQVNISYSAKEITGNPFADENTPLGISGEIIIEGKSIYIYENLSLKEISQLINSYSGVRSYTLNDILVIEKKTDEKNYFDLIDNTTGGLVEGLGMNRGYVFISLPAKNITGERNADDLTKLIGVSGVLEINNNRIEIGGEYFPSLREIAERINSLENTGVEATIVDNRLKITSRNGLPVQIRDYTSGGFSGGLRIYPEVLIVSYPENSVYSFGGNIYSETSNRVSDGVSGAIFNLKNPSSSEIKIQLTDQNNIFEVKENFKKFIEKWNIAVKNLNEYLRIDGENKKGIFYQSETLQNFYNKFVGNLNSSILRELEEIGIKKEENNLLTLAEEKLEKNINTNLYKVLKISGEIGNILSKFFENLIFADGIPEVDITENTRFTLYKREEALLTKFFLFKKGAIFEATA
jgi:hypothetical protein